MIETIMFLSAVFPGFSLVLEPRGGMGGAGRKVVRLVRNSRTMNFFGFEKPSVLWKKRVGTFDVKFDTSDNAFCKLTSLL